MLLLLRVLDPPGQVIDQDELDEGGVDEEHADPVPQVHGGQVRNNRQLGTKSGRKGIICICFKVGTTLGDIIYYLLALRFMIRVL